MPELCEEIYSYFLGPEKKVKNSVPGYHNK